METPMSETAFRANLDALFSRVQRSFDEVDPDLAECEVQFGALTVVLPAKKSKIILSAQPSVRQLWMAVASRGIAHHFSWDVPSQKWMDDKGQGIEAESFLKKLLLEEIRIDLQF